MPDPVIEKPEGKETLPVTTPPVSGEPGKETPPEPGDKGKSDDAFLEVEGMGKVKAADIKGLKAAQSGLEKEKGDLKKQVADLEKKIQEDQDKGLSDEEKRKKEWEAERAALAEDRAVLIDEKLALEFERAGIKVSHTAFKIDVSKLSEVKAAVAEFAEKYPKLVEKETPGKPKEPAPAGGTPGESPPALDKEKEWLARLKAAEIKNDMAEVKKIEAEINAYRGRESSDPGAASL